MKTFKLPFCKADNPISYSELKKLYSYENITFETSGSQMLKRMEMSMFEKIIDSLGSGNVLQITG